MTKSFIPGLKKPQKAYLSRFLRKAEKVPSFDYCPFNAEKTPFSPLSEHEKNDKNYSTIRALHELLTFCDLPSVVNASAFLRQLKRWKNPQEPILLELSKKVTSAAEINHLLRGARIYFERQFDNEDPHRLHELMNELLLFMKNVASLTLQLNATTIAARLNKQRRIAQAPLLKEIEVSEALSTLVLFQADYFESLINQLPAVEIFNLYQILVHLDVKQTRNTVLEVLIRRFSRYLAKHFHHGVRQFKHALILAIEAAKKNDETGIKGPIENAQLILKGLRNFEVFAGIAYGSSRLRSPSEECLLVYRQLLEKVPSAFRNLFTVSIPSYFESLSKDSLLNQSLVDWASNTHESSVDSWEGFSRANERIYIDDTKLLIDEEVFELNRIDSSFISELYVKNNVNEPPHKRFFWGVILESGEEKRISFESEQDFEDFLKIYNCVAGFRLTEKIASLLASGGRLEFNEIRLHNLGIEYPSPHKVWGAHTYLSCPWSKVQLEPCEEGFYFHADDRKFFVSSWEEKYFSAITPLLKLQNIHPKKTLSEQIKSYRNSETLNE